MSLTDNIQWRHAITHEAIYDTPPMTATEAADALFGWVYKGEGQPTIVDVRKAVGAVQERFGSDEWVCLLMRYGANNLKDLWLGSYEEVVKFAEACLKYGIPPSGSWVRNNDEYHPRSNDE